MVLIVAFVVGVYLARYTRFGRNVYAVGGNQESAMLMGLPVGRTRILVYTLNGFCAALAGVVATWYLGDRESEIRSLLEYSVMAGVNYAF